MMMYDDSMQVDGSRERMVIIRAQDLQTDLPAEIAPLSDHRLIGKETRAFKLDPAGLQFEEAELTHDEAANLEREKEVVATVPHMLLTHVAASATDAPDAAADDAEPPDMSWGIRAVGAEDLPRTAGADVRVAILDTGIDLTHPAFAGIDFTGCSKDFVGGGVQDRDGHGTHCAGTILGRDVTIDRKGQQRQVRIGIARGITQPLIARVLGSNGGSTESLLRGVSWAFDKKAHVICMSLGINFAQQVDHHVAKGRKRPEAYGLALADYRKVLLVFSAIVDQAAAQGDGPLIIAAAGNSSDRPEYAIDVEPPAASPGVLSVGALNSDLSVWKHSNQLPNLVAPGARIWSAAIGGGLCPADGTSMAAPHVAGLAALHAQRLLATGPFSTQALRDAVVRGTTTQPGWSRSDYGNGLARW